MPAALSAVQHSAGALWAERYGDSSVASAAVRHTSAAAVIEARRTARRRVRSRASNDRIVRPINVISAAVRVRRGMRPVNVSIASVVRTPGGP